MPGPSANNAVYYAELLGLDNTGSIYAGASVDLLVHNIDLDRYYCKIQQGIDDAGTGGETIEVQGGPYYENININKANLTLTNVSSPVIIDGGGSGTVVTITANAVTFEGFTVQNSGTAPTDLGVQLYMVSGCTVEGNTLINNANGLFVIYGTGNFITSNTVNTNTYYGVGMAASTGNTINLNNISANGLDAIALDNGDAVGGNINDGSTGNFIIGNTLSSNRDGIFFGENCDNNEVTDVNQITATNRGISFWRSGGHTITDNTITSTGSGIHFLGSSDNTLTGNTITGNDTGLEIDASWQVGVWYPSLDNTISENNISGNSSYGVDATDNQNGLVDISYNWWGDPSGPFNDPYNLCGLGNEVDGNLIFMPWYYDAAMTTLNGIPNLALSAIADISTVTHTPVIISETVTYPDLTDYDPAVLVDALLSTTTTFPAGVKVFQINYTDGANPPVIIPISPAYDLAGLSQVYLSDILGTPATPLVGHSNKVINWKIYVEGASAPATNSVSIQSVSYLTKTGCNSNLGSPESFNVTFADASLALIEEAEPVCYPTGVASFVLTLTHPTIDPITGEILSNATIVSDKELPVGTTIYWTYDYSGPPSTPNGSLTLTTATSTLYLSEIVSGTQGNLISPNFLGHTGDISWKFDVEGLDPGTYNFEIQAAAQLPGQPLYEYATMTPALQIIVAGATGVDMDEILDISTVTSTPVIVPVSIAYPDLALQAIDPSVLTDARITTTLGGGFPAGARIFDITYDGASVLAAPLMIAGESELFLSEILGPPAPTALLGHSGLTLNWKIYIDGITARGNRSCGS